MQDGVRTIQFLGFISFKDQTEKNIRKFQRKIRQPAEDWQKFWNSAKFLELVFIAFPS